MQRGHERRKELVPCRKLLKKKLGADAKVYIAYPAVLKYVDENGRHKTVDSETLMKLRQEIREEQG